MNTLAQELPASINNARAVGVFETGSPEWHAQRKTGIGGSDIGTIVGLNKWQSAYTLWAKRNGHITEEPLSSEAAEWGNRLEGVIIDKFEEAHPEITVFRDAGSWQSSIDGEEWQLSNPDALYLNADGEWEILEVKTAQYEDDWSEKDAQIPPAYMAQIQWYLRIFSLKRATCAVLFHGNKYREFVIEADSFMQDSYIQAATAFYEDLKQDTAPSFDGSTSTYETVRAMHPLIDEQAEEELGDLGVHYFVAKQDFQKAEFQFNEMKSRVIDAMGNAKKGLIYGNWEISRQARGGGTPFLVEKKGK